MHKGLKRLSFISESFNILSLEIRIIAAINITLPNMYKKIFPQLRNDQNVTYMR